MFLPIFLASVNPCRLSAWIAKIKACRPCLGAAAETRLRRGVTGPTKDMLMPSRTNSLSNAKTGTAPEVTTGFLSGVITEHYSCQFRQHQPSLLQASSWHFDANSILRSSVPSLCNHRSSPSILGSRSTPCPNENTPNSSAKCGYNVRDAITLSEAVFMREQSWNLRHDQYQHGRDLASRLPVLIPIFPSDSHVAQAQANDDIHR